MDAWKLARLEADLTAYLDEARSTTCRAAASACMSGSSPGGLGISNRWAIRFTPMSLLPVSSLQFRRAAGPNPLPFLGPFRLARAAVPAPAVLHLGVVAERRERPVLLAPQALLPRLVSGGRQHGDVLLRLLSLPIEHDEDLVSGGLRGHRHKGRWRRSSSF